MEIDVYQFQQTNWPEHPEQSQKYSWKRISQSKTNRGVANPNPIKPLHPQGLLVLQSLPKHLKALPTPGIDTPPNQKNLRRNRQKLTPMQGAAIGMQVREMSA